MYHPKCRKRNICPLKSVNSRPSMNSWCIGQELRLSKIVTPGKAADAKDFSLFLGQTWWSRGKLRIKRHKTMGWYGWLYQQFIWSVLIVHRDTWDHIVWYYLYSSMLERYRKNQNHPLSCFFPTKSWPMSSENRSGVPINCCTSTKQTSVQRLGFNDLMALWLYGIASFIFRPLLTGWLPSSNTEPLPEPCAAGPTPGQGWPPTHRCGSAGSSASGALRPPGTGAPGKWQAASLDKDPQQKRQCWHFADL